MTFKKLLMIPLLAALPAVTGCSSDCESACEDAKDCPGANTSVDCDKLCEDSEKAAKDLGCEDQYDDYASCMADQDACKADAKACEKESTAFNTCVCKASGIPAEQCTFDEP